MPVRSCYIDVDMTLVKDGKLRRGVRERLKAWESRYTLICWSHGGGAYAFKVCRQHGIEEFFTHFLDKPDIIVDDNPEFILHYPAILDCSAPGWWEIPERVVFEGSRMLSKEPVAI